MYGNGGGEGCVCVWVGGVRGVRTNFFCFGGGVLSKFLLDNQIDNSAR